MSNSYNVAFYDRDEQIDMREISVGFIENSFPRHKPFVDHVFVGWKTDGRTYREIWPGDKFYLIDESCSYVSEYELPLNLHICVQPPTRASAPIHVEPGTELH